MKASDIQIPEPCNEDWDAMTPAERGRFCSSCQKKVHDLSAMPESDARALLNADDDADICISYLSTAAGEVRFQPERVVPLHRLVRRASVATAAGLSLALAACAPHGDGPRIEDTSEAERPAFLEFEPAIPTAEPCETQPPPEVAPEVAPYDEIAPKADPRVRGRLVRAPEPEKLQRLEGARRRVDPPKREKL